LFDPLSAYLSLFFAAFFAATILPFNSEVVLVMHLVSGHAAWNLWCMATLGNTLGAAVNWVLGRSLMGFRERFWFPVKEEELAKAQRWFQRFGVWSLLLAWLPVVGDALTFIAGVMRVPFLIFFVLTLMGKGARYAVLILTVRQALEGKLGL
jgi:membrane protein YqaA with SNARE-associated domain